MDVRALKRQFKAISETFSLLDVRCNGDYQVVCKILGSTGNDYELTLSSWDCHVYTHCTCNDHVYRNTICKHMYWFGQEHFQGSKPIFWTIHDVNRFLNEFLYEQNLQEGINAICPICFNYIDYDTENTICCVTCCLNSVHTECWRRYTHVVPSLQCVICRRPTMPSW
jgi:hypothetical protein